MTEADQIRRTRQPVTTESLLAELRSLGIRAGDVVTVHASLSALGWVNGGPVAVVEALLWAVGPGGTVVMPTQSAGLTDPETWEAPPVPHAWLDTIRDTMPAYDPRITPTREMGRIAELFRTWPGALRSDHPSTSFAALGPLAREITRNHALEDPLGQSSPLGTLYRLAAKVLLIGVDFDRCTALHLAEDMAWPERPKTREGAPLTVDGQRRWVWFEVPKLMNTDAFVPVGASALRAGVATAGPLGEGQGIIMEMRRIVDHAVSLWSKKPDGAAGEQGV